MPKKNKNQEIRSNFRKMISHARKTMFLNTSNKTQQIAPTSIQYGTNSGPKTTLEALRKKTPKLIINSAILGRPTAPKENKKSQKITKTSFRVIDSNQKNVFPGAAFLDFWASQEVPDPGNQAKTL